MPAEGATGFRHKRRFPSRCPRQAGWWRDGAGTNISDGKTPSIRWRFARLRGLGIDDLDIEISGEEPPAADGSALPFASALLKAGLREKPGQERAYLNITEKIGMAKGDIRYSAGPARGVSFKLIYDYPHALVGRQVLELTLTPEEYLAGVAPARTFGFSHEIEALKAAGLALGGSLENAIVIGEKEIMAKDGLRFPDEFARHKLLDLIGDLALAGLPLRDVHIEAERPGHAANVNFAKLLSEKGLKP